MNIIQITDILAGGVGSGCHGPNCGRPLSKQEKAKWIKKQIQKHKQVAIAPAKKWWRKEFKKRAKAGLPAARPNAPKIGKKAEKWLKKNAGKITKKLPTGLIKKSGKEMIKDVQPAAKRWVKQQMKLPGGEMLEILKPPGQKEKSGTSWLKKISPYKGRFSQEIAQASHFFPEEKNNISMAVDILRQRAVAVETHRDFGSKKVTVKEIDLLDLDGAIGRTRKVVFHNIGTAAGFLNRRYGITYKFK